MGSLVSKEKGEERCRGEEMREARKNKFTDERRVRDE